MIKKCFVIICSIFILPAYAKVIAPAVQYNTENYPYYFIDTTDYRIKLNTLTKYRIKCDFDIDMIETGDKENIRIINDSDEEKSLFDIYGPNQLTIKTKYETYTYLNVKKKNGETVNIMVSVNKENKKPYVINAGLCSFVEK